jgi:hypothetical protein
MGEGERHGVNAPAHRHSACGLVVVGLVLSLILMSGPSYGRGVDLSGEWSSSSGGEFGSSYELAEAAARLVLEHRNGRITGTLSLASTGFGHARPLTTATFLGDTLTITAQGNSCLLRATLRLEIGSLIDTLSGPAFCTRTIELFFYRPGTKMRVSAHRDHSDRSIVITRIGPS